MVCAPCSVRKDTHIEVKVMGDIRSSSERIL